MSCSSILYIILFYEYGLFASIFIIYMYEYDAVLKLLLMTRFT